MGGQLFVDSGGICTCIAGTDAANELCLHCEAGKYKVVDGFSVCVVCLPAMSTASSGSSDANDCVCPVDSSLMKSRNNLNS